MTDGVRASRRTATVTVLFCDLVDSTARQTRVGDDLADEFRDRFFTVLREAVARTNGEEVKNLGDGLMIVFRHSTANAVSCAEQMHRGVETFDPDDPSSLYVGISVGEAASDGDDWFGTPVVEAARLCSAAKPGQTLANEVVRTLVGSRGGFAFRSVGRLDLKGLAAPVAAVEVVRPPTVERVPEEAASRDQRASRKPLIVAAAVILVIALTVAALAIVACGGTKSGKGAHAVGVAAPHNYPVSYVTKPCLPDDLRQKPGLVCGTLTVPEDRTRPSGRVVKLDVQRAPARGGARGTPTVDFGADDLATSPARDTGEEIVLAQRGWRGSKPILTCPEYAKLTPDQLTRPVNDPLTIKLGTEALATCHKRWGQAGVNLDAYNYLNVGRDMADLVRALRLPHVNVVSGYVATISALEVIRELPNAVRTLTLQAPVAPGRSTMSDPTKELAGAVDRYFALCRADAACQASFPDLRGDLKRDYDTYRLHPRVVQGDDGDGHKHAVRLDGSWVAYALDGGLMSSDSYPVLAAGVAAPDRSGVIDQLTAGRVIASLGPSLDADFPWGALFANSCSYDVYTIDQGRELSDRTVPELSGIDSRFLESGCEAYPVRKIDAAAFDDPSTSVPTLVVNGLLAPGADPDWTLEFRRGFPNITVVDFPTVNANILADNVPACLGQLRRTFYTDPTKPLAAAACARESPPIHFVASIG